MCVCVYTIIVSHLKLRKFFEKIRMFLEKLIHIIDSINQNIQGVRAKTLLFIDFSKKLDSIEKGKTHLIPLPYGLHKEIVIALMMLYKSMKAMVHSPDRDANFFNIVAGV